VLVLRSMQEHDLGRQQLDPTGMMRRDKVFWPLLEPGGSFQPEKAKTTTTQTQPYEIHGIKQAEERQSNITQPNQLLVPVSPRRLGGIALNLESSRGFASTQPPLSRDPCLCGFAA
jgi:hypothetical protein